MKTKESFEIKYKISYVNNLITVLEDLIKYHEFTFEREFVNCLNYISKELSKYIDEMYESMSELEKKTWISDSMDFGSYYSSRETTPETHKYELMQEAYTQAFGIQENFNRFFEFPLHLKNTAKKIYGFVDENKVYQKFSERIYNE